LYNKTRRLQRRDMKKESLISEGLMAADIAAILAKSKKDNPESDIKLSDEVGAPAAEVGSAFLPFPGLPKLHRVVIREPKNQHAGPNPTQVIPHVKKISSTKPTAFSRLLCRQNANRQIAGSC